MGWGSCALELAGNSFLSDYSYRYSRLLTQPYLHFVVESGTLDVKEHHSNEGSPTVGRTEAVKNGFVKGQ